MGSSELEHTVDVLFDGTDKLAFGAMEKILEASRVEKLSSSQIEHWERALVASEKARDVALRMLGRGE